MLATENLKEKNFLPKIFSEEKNITQSVTLSPTEMKYSTNEELHERMRNFKC